VAPSALKYLWFKDQAAQRGASLNRDIGQTIGKNGLRSTDDIECLAQELDLAALCHEPSGRTIGDIAFESMELSNESRIR
jgi:hypothetical protein